MKKPDIVPEFSRPLTIDRIPDDGLDRTLTAKEDERQRLADRFGLLSLDSLTAALHVQVVQRGQVEVSGHLTAEVVQQCVVTLEPLSSRVECDIDVQCMNEPDFNPGSSNLITPDEEDVEPIIDGVINLGEIVAQHFGAALDPYPRKPGLSPVNAEYSTNAMNISPLAKLVELKAKK